GPAVGGAAVERTALVGGGPGLGVARSERPLGGSEVEGESQQAAVPAHAGGAGPEGLPHLGGDVGGAGDVLELDTGGLLALGGEAEGQPGHATHHLPGHGEFGGAVGRRLAAEDLAAGVALELVAAAELQLAREGEEPAGDALNGGDGVPHVGEGGGVGLFEG